MPYIHDDSGVRVNLPPQSGDRVVEDRKAVREEWVSYGINTATTTVVKATSGWLRSITILGGPMGKIDVYDNSAASGTKLIPTFTPPAGAFGTLTFNIPFGSGLTIVTAAATTVQVSYT